MGLARLPRLGARRLLLLGILAALVALGTFLVVRSINPYYGHGVSNAKIVSPTRFEFDYHADQSCKFEDVVYVFFDGNGKKLGRFADTTMNAVVAGKDYHYIITADQPSMTLDPRAVRFEADASCNGNG
jgi:hypothetical protein